MQDQMIYVPALMDRDKVIVPQVWLGKNVEYRSRGDTLSAAEYQDFNPPTLAELRHAYFDETGGSFVSPEYRQSVQAKRGYGEWTSTFLRDGKELIERPENVVYRNGVWVVEGGKIILVELPPDGWTLEYDKRTGFPSRTSKNRRDAEEVFGNDASRFYATRFYSTRSGIKVIRQIFGLGRGAGPFDVDADSKPDTGSSNIGGRVCRRSEQAAASAV